MFTLRDPVNLDRFYESHLHFCPDLYIKLVEIYTASRTSPRPKWLYVLVTFQKPTAAFLLLPIIGKASEIRKFMVIMIYLSEAIKNVGSGIRGGGGRHAPVYPMLSLSSGPPQAPPQPLLPQSPQAQGCCSHSDGA